MKLKLILAFVIGGTAGLLFAPALLYGGRPHLDTAGHVLAVAGAILAIIGITAAIRSGD